MFLIHKYITTKKEANTKNKFLQSKQSLMAKRYTFNDILLITNHLADKLGEGRFGAIYKGKLPYGDSVVVKILENCWISDKDFMKEIAKFIRINHVNLVHLAGFCCEESKRALMYDFMPNGSLDEHRLSKSGVRSVIWNKLDQIALGTARGIDHLHTLGTDSCILHLNIMPRNVLLDQDFVPKVTDFGMTMFYPKDYDFLTNSTESAEVKYIAPELMSGNYAAATCKSDVYSIGMLFLDLVGLGKITEEGSSKVDYLSSIYDRLSAGESLDLGNVTEMEAKMAKKLCKVGFWCIQMKPSERPSMSKVVEMLRNGTDELQMPPKSFLISDVNIPKEETLSDSSTELLIPELLEKSQ